MNRDRSSREYTGARPYTYHYDGALFDGPDQYVNLVLSSDGVLQSEVMDDDEEENMEEDASVKEAPSINSPGTAGLASDIESYSRNQSYASEPRGYIQVTHTTKNKNDGRVTVSRTVPEILETLPSLDEAVLQPVPCESELYDKWARLPRMDPDSTRPSARSVTVTAKGWTILQSMQNKDQPTPVTIPAANDPALLALADEECTTLDSIIDHYNQMYLVQTGTAPMSVKHGQLDPRRPDDENTELKVPNKSKPPQTLSPVIKKAYTTNPNYSSAQDISASNVTPIAPKKSPQQQSIPAATASIDWPPGTSQSDKIYQMARFWSWRPSKPSVKVQKNYKPSPNPTEKLDRNQRSIKKDTKLVGKGNSRKSGPGLTTSDNASANRTSVQINSVRMNQLSAHGVDNMDDRLSPTRARLMGMKSTGYGDGTDPSARADGSVDSGTRISNNNHDQPQKISEMSLKPEYDFVKLKPSPRTSVGTGGKQYKQTASTSQTRAGVGAQARPRPRLLRMSDAGDSRSVVQRANGDAEFLDFNELNLGHSSRINHRQKNQALAISLRGRSTDHKSTI